MTPNLQLSAAVGSQDVGLAGGGEEVGGSAAAPSPFLVALPALGKKGAAQEDKALGRSGRNSGCCRNSSGQRGV